MSTFCKYLTICFYTAVFCLKINIVKVIIEFIKCILFQLVIDNITSILKTKMVNIISENR